MEAEYGIPSWLMEIRCCLTPLVVLTMKYISLAEYDDDAEQDTAMSFPFLVRVISDELLVPISQVMLQLTVMVCVPPE